MTEPVADDRNPLTTSQGLLQLIVVLQVAILVGIAILVITLGGLPDEVAGRVPTFDNSGQIFELQNSIDGLSTKIDAIQAVVGASSAP
jgi:hypothetical protein